MKTINRLLTITTALMCFTVIILQSGCSKDKGYYDLTEATAPEDMNTYQYLQSKRGIYDSLLYVIDRTGFTDTLKNNQVTLFAPTNESFKLAITNLNNLRAKSGKNPLFLSNIDKRHLDTLVSKYIIRGLYTSDSLTRQDGLMLTAVKYNQIMHAKLFTSTSSGYLNGGPSYIQYDNTKQSIFNRDWATATTSSIDIKTTNGIVQVIEPNHVFGFDEFVTRITYIPKVRTPFFGVPLQIPGLINAVDYDLGGQGVAYSDADPANNPRFYRSAEGVDIEPFQDGFNISETVTGEWLAYTVNVAEAGDYEMTFLLGSDQDNKKFNLEVDGVNVTGGTLTIPNTGDSRNWATITGDVSLTAGKHTLRFNVVSGGFKIFQFIFNAKFKNLPSGLTATWQEHWGNHNQLLKLFDYDDHVAVYHDKYMYPSVKWPKKVFNDAWAYVKQNYGGDATFGPDQRLRLILHRVVPETDNLGGGHPAHFGDASHDFHNVLDCGLGDWTFPEGQNIGLPIHEMGHIVEDNIDGIKGSPTGAIWGDSKFMEIFNYDVYKHIGKGDMAEAMIKEMEEKNPYREYPGRAYPGVRWFTEWFHPIYNQHGGVKLLYKYFQILRANYPRNGNRIERSADMNLGEFVHFYSGAAGVDLSTQAAIAFNPVLGADHWQDKDDQDPTYWPPYKAPQYWTLYGRAQFLKAQKDFPNVKY
jgi:uncharacterized surface protein with fasciclin (FAS1) repeats